MSEMERISEAVLTKVRAEADGIVAEARARAAEALARAKAQADARIAEERSRMLEEAKVDAARVLAQSTIAARQELLKAKTAVVDEVFAAAAKSLTDGTGAAEGLRNLVSDGIDTLGLEKVRVIASQREACVVRELLKADQQLAGRVAEVKEGTHSGGVIAEDLEGRLRVDNTYETRLAMLRPTLLVEIGRELAGS